MFCICSTAHTLCLLLTSSTNFSSSICVFAYSYPTESKLWCSMRRTGWAILGTYVGVTIFCIPVYLSFTITSGLDDDGYVIYRVSFRLCKQTQASCQMNEAKTYYNEMSFKELPKFSLILTLTSIS